MKKLYLFLVALLCTTGAWAGAGFWSEKAVKSLVLSVDEKANTYQWNSTNVNAVDLGEISSLSITSYEVNVWKDGDNKGNICTSKMQYRVYKTTETAGDWQDIVGTWKSNDDNNSNNQVWGTSENANKKDVTPKAPGSYKLEMQFISTGSESSTDCGTTFTLNNNGKYYVLTFTIPTPIVPYVLFGEDVPSEVEAGTEIALSATSANFEGDVTYAYSVKVPDGTDFVAIEGTTYTPSTVGTYTLKVVATSGNQSAEKEQTLTVKAAAIDIDIRVQIPTGLTGWVYATAPYLYFWNDDDISDTWVAMTDEGDNWYKGTIHAASINFIVVNGSSWNALGGSAPRQSVDVKGVTASGCYILVDNGSDKKKNISATDCPSNEPSVAFDGVATAVKCGDVITLSATAKNFTSDVTLAYSVKVPGSEEFAAIDGTSYTPSTVGTYTLKVVATAGEEKAEKTMEITATIDCYLAGTGIEGLDWQDNQMPMYGNTITLSNVAANTKISFKVVYQGGWLGIAAVDTDNSSDGVAGEDNIEITTSEVCDVTITYDPESKKIVVTGKFGGVVTITSYTVVGYQALMGSEWKVDDTANDMTKAEDGDVWTLVKKDVELAVGTYSYQAVANHAWDVKKYPSQGTNSIEIKTAGVYTITFTLNPEAASDNLTAEAVITITSYTIAGDEALMGSKWKEDDTNNDMTLNEGVWTLVKKNVALAAQTYEYKAVANHTWGELDFPNASNTNQQVTVEEAGYYTVTFTLVQETSLECKLEKTGDFEYKYSVMYGIEGSNEAWTSVVLAQVGETTEWKSAEITLPDDISNYKCYVAYNNGTGEPAFVQDKSATVALSSVGGENGAKGTFRIYSDSSDSNWFLAFAKTSSTPTGLTENSACSVFAQDGTIYADGNDLRIYTLTGIEVTAQNGALNGIYVVKTNGKILKVSVR